MNHRKRVVALLLVMTVVCVTVGGVSIAIPYRANLDHQRARLVEIVQGLQARLEIAPGPTRNSERRRAALASREVKLERMWERLRDNQGLGKTGEFSLAVRDGENIVWTISLNERAQKDVESPQTAPWNSKFAAPMRRALSGQEGTTMTKWTRVRCESQTRQTRTRYLMLAGNGWKGSTR